MKKYKLHEPAKNSDGGLNQQTITVTETVEQENKITIAQLLDKHALKVKGIKRSITEADSIVDELDAIEAELGIEITDKPRRIKLYSSDELKSEVESA